MRVLPLVVLAALLGCSAEPPSGTGGGGGGATGGGGAPGGGAGGGGGTALDAGRPEGTSCTSSADCAAGLTCETQVTASGTATRCAACASGGQACRDGGVCITVVQGAGTSLVCTEGGPGEPCTTASQCRSGQCDTTVTAGGTTQRCR